jgi:MoxR-like ATPase
MENKFNNDAEAIDFFKETYQKLFKEINKVVVGQEQVVTEVLISVFSKGHCLLIGVPGLAKTLLVNTIAQSLGLKFSRIQFTPDLMPSDIIGSEILNDKKEFEFIKGPLFAQIILADEINRTPPKTQAALLEAMQERAITTAGKTYKLQEPFFVLATQNPIEQEGTYPLPEAQLDRFMFSINLDYPSYESEIQVVKNTTAGVMPFANNILNQEEIIFFQNLIRKIPVADNVIEYAVKLASKSRPNTQLASKVANDYVAWGAGPRASQNLIAGAKTHAAIKGKYSPDIEDVKAVAKAILRHRVVQNYKADVDGYNIEKIIETLINE